MYKVIIDCDPGHDDAVALLLAARAENIDLLGVTTVAGNSELHHTTVNARKVLDFAGLTDVPVFAGAAKPLMRDLFRLTGVAIHGEDGLGGPVIPEPQTPIENESALSFLIRKIKASEEKVVLIATGPLTNVALAFMADPTIKEKIDRLIIMGGAVYTEGNVTSAAEFNIFVDPEAAKVVFQSGVPIYLVSLDATMKALFKEEDIEALRAQEDEVSVLVAELMDFFANSHLEHFKVKEAPIHDALCVAILLDEDLVNFQHTYVDISLHDPLTLGETVADLWGITEHEKNAYISTDVDRERFVELVKSHMKSVE